MLEEVKVPASQVIVQTALAYLDKGNRAPTVEQLLEPLDGQAPETPRAIAILLGQARRKLENSNKFDVCICSVSRMYYTSFQDNPPKNEEEALRCIPGGKLPDRGPNRIAGLYFPKTGGDLIFQEWVLRYARQGMSQTELNKCRIERGVKQKVLSRSVAPKRFADYWVEFFGEALAPIFERQIGKAVERLTHDAEKTGKPTTV